MFWNRENVAFNVKGMLLLLTKCISCLIYIYKFFLNKLCQIKSLETCLPFDYWNLLETWHLYYAEE